MQYRAHLVAVMITVHMIEEPCVGVSNVYMLLQRDHNDCSVSSSH